ncbi:CopG family transcriptional regulator [Thermus sp.]|uniref:ribbon-helix-helix domain-containing protein n=1 Tax=Thermus sp. TaxID=275 RepID=UPI003D10D39A
MDRNRKRKLPRTPYMHIYMDPEIQALIKEEAERRGMNTSELIRTAVSLYLTGLPWQEWIRQDPEKFLEKAKEGEIKPQSWDDFYRMSTLVFIGTSKLVESWRQYLINKAKAEAEGLTYEEWLRKNIDEGPPRRE